MRSCVCCHTSLNIVYLSLASSVVCLRWGDETAGNARVSSVSSLLSVNPSLRGSDILSRLENIPGSKGMQKAACKRGLPRQRN